MSTNRATPDPLEGRNIGRSSSRRAGRSSGPRVRSVAGSIAMATMVASSVGALAVTSAGPASADSRRVPFSNFSSCPRLMAYLQSLTLPTVGPYGLGSAGVASPADGSPRPTKKASRATPNPTPVPAAPAATAAGAPATEAAAAVEAAPAAPVSADATAASGQGGTSTTNTQEVGVDEGDEVETDGRYVYTAIGGGTIRIIDTTTGSVVARLDGYGNGADPKLILDGTRLAVTRDLWDQFGPETIVEQWSVADPTRPQLLGRTHLEGSALAVRSVDHRARIILTSPLGSRIRYIQPADNTDLGFERATAANRRAIKNAKVTDWLPRIYHEDASGNPSPVRPALDCREVGKPADPSGFGLVWVATIDLDVAAPRTGARGSGGVVTSGGTIYSSANTLYVSTTTGNYFGGPVPVVKPRGATVRAPTPRPLNIETALHAFDLAPADGATYLASGSVPGTLLNQFSMSEFDGVLRVATTTPNEGFGTRQESTVYAMNRNGRSIDVIGKVGGLGRNEQIYAVRFLGDLGYVVTFRQTDPLYVIDLRNPRAPRVAGELKIPGYSAYLHPMAPGYLIGVGQDATDNGRRLGSMLQVFDVRDPYNPRQTAKLRLGGSSEAEYDHHAFLWWPRTADAFVPNQNYDQTNGRQSSSLIVANVTTGAISERGRLTHDAPLPSSVTPGNPGIPASVPPGGLVPTTIVRSPNPFALNDPIRRALIVNGRLVTVSAAAATVSDLASLKPTFFTRFDG
jgi:Beta propeller domain